MTKSILTVAFILSTAVLVAPRSATAQNEVLAEMYGRGVHAYYAGDNDTATEFLTMAIDNGSQDPRAYYFRGLVAYGMGQTDAAKDDWQRGAELEASGNVNASIGRSLSRFQGTGRIELESIRQQARLKALAEASKRSQARYGEISAAEARVLRKPPQPAAPAAAASPAAAPPAAPPAAAPPAAVPPVADAEDPFADDMAIGEPSVQSDDALKGAMENPFAGKSAVPAGSVPPNDTTNPFGGATGGNASDPFGDAPAAGSDPFGGAGADPFGGGAGADPFGGGADAPSGAGADPFGGGADASGGADAGAGADPFGGGADAGADPFGGGADAGADPFGGGADDAAGADPFGN